MTITAKMIEDSTNGVVGGRLTTFQLKYPRFIHAEELTHRALETSAESIIEYIVPDGVMYDPDLSRNASSSRAVPVSRMIQDILDDTAMPIHWGKNQPGMSAKEECTEPVLLNTVCDADGVLDVRSREFSSKEAWLYARDRAIEVARAFADAGYHKQVVNRLLEPFMHISVVVTASNFSNFFALRRHADAQPEIKALADAMWDAYQASTPKLLKSGDWHLPYVTSEERHNHTLIDCRKMSVARCARVSYLTHDGAKPDFSADKNLYERLVGSVPLHASPTEHQATADLETADGWNAVALSGNFGPGWIQLRKLLPYEYISEYKDAA